MSFNYDYTRKDGTIVMVTYRFQAEIDFGKVYGLPNGEELTADEYEEIEADIFSYPFDYDPTDDCFWTHMKGHLNDEKATDDYSSASWSHNR